VSAPAFPQAPAGASAAVTEIAPVRRETIVILDFGSQYSRLIARRVRECRVYCEVLPWDAPAETVRRLAPKGIILSGGPASVYEPGAPTLPDVVLELGVPVLGICYGMQLLAHRLGGQVAPGERREYGHAQLDLLDRDEPLFRGLSDRPSVWMSHGDQVADLRPGFRAVAQTVTCPTAAMRRDPAPGSPSGVIVGLQFHPEVAHTPQGQTLLQNFCYDLSGCEPTWTPGSFIAEAVAQVRAKVGGGRVLCAFSGGVDSSVAAALLHRAIGDQLTCVFVDNGLLRKNEAQTVVRTFREHLGFNLRHVDAGQEFLSRLKGVTDPEEKRAIVGERFIRVFEREARALEAAHGPFAFLAQGTLYPDVIESATPEAKAAAKIKTHHNVGGLPKDLSFQLIEPLRYLFKDEARAVGTELGLPDEIVWRDPFPGPGLAVRVLGEVTEERLAILREADAIFVEEIKAAGLYRRLGQVFAVLTDSRSTGVQGDFRTYGHVIALRAITTDDFMTADWARLPYEVLATAASRIANEVKAVNRVVYDVTSKPPATVEWE
jgi:GMP synthase (glutamine-hydrolysing)